MTIGEYTIMCMCASRYPHTDSLSYCPPRIRDRKNSEKTEKRGINIKEDYFTYSSSALILDFSENPQTKQGYAKPEYHVYCQAQIIKQP